jgi:hypothetical protein
MRAKAHDRVRKSEYIVCATRPLVRYKWTWVEEADQLCQVSCRTQKTKAVAQFSSFARPQFCAFAFKQFISSAVQQFRPSAVLRLCVKAVQPFNRGPARPQCCAFAPTPLRTHRTRVTRRIRTVVTIRCGGLSALGMA